MSLGSTVLWIPCALAVSDCDDATTRTFSARRSGSGSRPRSAVAGSSATPLSVADEMSATQSTNVDAPGSRQVNVMVEVASSTAPSKRPRRSTSMS